MNSSRSDGEWNALALLARGLAGMNVQVQGLPDARAVLTANTLLLPQAPENRLWHRAMVAHAVAHLRYSPPGRSANALKPMGVAVVSAIEDARVERLLCREFPGLQGWFAQALASATDPLDLRFEALVARMDRVLLEPARQDDNHWVNKARRLFEEAVASAGLDNYEAFRSVASILANDLGQMRVRFEPQEYRVPAPYRDDNSYLWDFGESDLPPDAAIAVQRSMARASAPPEAAPRPAESIQAREQDVELGRYSYPEWDRRLERLRPDWCTVIEKVPAWQGLAAPGAWTLAQGGRSTVLHFPRARQLDRTHRLRRQWEGDDIDLNAAIEVLVHRRLRLRPDPRLFMRPGKGPQPSSILVLLDLSASANDPGPHAESMLDLEKEAALLLAASSTHGIDRLAIHGFSSNTREQVYYYRLLEAGRPLDGSAQALIGAVRGRFSTRMGAALRHAASLLQAEPPGQRAVLLVTDGAPSDIDVHDAHYLIEDARHAVAEARMAGVRVACIAVDGAADAYVRRIFGWRNYCIVDDARSLHARLARMSDRLVSGH